MKRWQERQKLRLGVRQFCWDDSYYFHTTEQMDVVGQLCPNIQELHFMYENRWAPDTWCWWKTEDCEEKLEVDMGSPGTPASRRSS